MRLSLGAAAGAVARFNRGAAAQRGLGGAVRTTIGAAPEGQRVHLIGAIADGERLEAPVSRRPCVYYALTVEIDEGRITHRIDLDRQAVPFVVSDGTGRALIEAAGAELEIDAGRRTGVLEPAQLAEAAGPLAMVRDRFGARRVRYREVALEIGATVAVIGTAVREPDPTAVRDVTGYRAGPPTRLRLGRSEAHALWISDAADALRAPAPAAEPTGDPAR